MKILIDNGHGIDTPGKCSPDGSHREWAWTRELAQMLVEELTRRGYDAQRVVTESNDISLKERCRRVNTICDSYGKNNCILVSLHNNAAGADGKWKTAGGWCVYTSPGQTKADELATDLFNAAKTALKDYVDTFPVHKAQAAYDSRQTPLRSDFSDGDPDYEARFYILLHTKCPAVLTESMFQDNRADVRWLNSAEGKRAIVQLHADGIETYIKRQSR